MRIRQGNDFIFLWAIERNELPEDFSNAVNIKLHFKNFDCVGEVKSFQIVDGNIVRVEVSPEWASRLGAYRLILSYEFEDLSYSDGDQKCVVDVLAFNIVPKTSEADDVTEMAKTTDIMIGLKGDKGDPFTYEDFTPEQLENIEQPITDFVAVAEVAENQREENEGVRVDNENIRISNEDERILSEDSRVLNEGKRVDAEIIREQQEEARQTNTATAITNAENAITDVNAAKDDYYDVVKPAIQIQGEYATAQGDYAKAQGEAIQDDLALKANHGYESIEVAKTLKQVEDDTSVKMTNLVVNGGFESGITSWSGAQPVLSEEEKLSGDSSGYANVVNNISYSRIDIVCDLNDKLYISVSRRFKTTPSITIYAMLISNFGSLTNSIPLGLFYNGNLDVWETTTSIVNGRANGVRLGVGIFGAATVQYFVDNFIAVNLTQTFGKGSEPTKEEFELLLATLGIDFFEGEITVPAQKIMQWQLALIRKNKNAIIALGGTII